MKQIILYFGLHRRGEAGLCKDSTLLFMAADIKGDNRARVRTPWVSNTEQRQIQKFLAIISIGQQDVGKSTS